MKTSLGDEKQEELLSLLNPIIKEFCKKHNKEVRHVRSTISYIWEEEARKEDESWDNYLSKNEIGPYGGR
jgi:hypothetical protein